MSFGWKFMGHPPDLRAEERMCAIQNCYILVGSTFSYKPIWGDSGCPVISLNETDSCKAFWEFKLALGNSPFRDDFPTIPHLKWAFRLPARFILIVYLAACQKPGIPQCPSPKWLRNRSEQDCPVLSDTHNRRTEAGKMKKRRRGRGRWTQPTLPHSLYTSTTSIQNSEA